MQKIFLHFEDFQLEPIHDILSILSKSTHYYHGASNVSEFFYPEGTAVLLTFDADCWIAYRGFKIHYGLAGYGKGKKVSFGKMYRLDTIKIY